MDNTTRCVNPVFLLEQPRNYQDPTNPRGKTSAWSYDMEGHARKCVERYRELANKKTEQLCKVSHPCFDDHQINKEELCNETQTADKQKQAQMKNRDRETRMKWDDRSTLFPDGLRVKAPVRSQHHDVCRAHACRETTGMTTQNFSRSPDKLENKGELSEVCTHIVLKNACTSHELVDLTFCGQSTNWHDRSQNGPKHVTNA